MRIAIGRRQIVVSVVNQPARVRTEEFPMAVNATDQELARLNALNNARLDRARWETAALMYGSGRLNTA
jgi:hypothetical protein